MKLLYFLSCCIALLLLGCEKDPDFPRETLPELGNSGAIASITTTSAISSGYVVSSGGALITARGICWSSSGTPTINNNKTVEPGGLGNFTSQLKGLTTRTVYYVRAYATNSVGTAYGPTLSFITR
jgi:hypothetical protein